LVTFGTDDNSETFLENNMLSLPSWPAGISRDFHVLGQVKLPSVQPEARRDFGILQARRLARRRNSFRNSFLTGTVSELIFANRSDFTALASFTSEASLIAGTNQQPVIPALFFNDLKGFGRTISIVARGVLSSTSTPTYTFQFRLGTTAGSTFLSGTSIGVSAAITTGSSITNKWWEARLDLSCYTPGIGTGNTTLSGSGFVRSPSGFASPFTFPMLPTTPDTATWTSVIDAALTQHLNFSVTCSSSSASNTIQCKQLYVHGLN